MPGKGSPHLHYRIPRKYLLDLQLEARRAGITPSKELRNILKDHFERVASTQASGGLHRETLTRLTKQYIIRAQQSRQVTKVPMKDSKEPGLPGTAKRSELETIVWQAVQAAVTYSKTEEDSEMRLLALRVANGLMRTELAILKHQDDAFVDALLEELGADADGLAAKTRKGS
ncbi:MAG: hypothetical protein ABSE39_04600 [Candidatus Bathyarchaeia archaeon]